MSRGNLHSAESGVFSDLIKTTGGAMRFERPRIRDAGKLRFESRILGNGLARTHAVESLVISAFLRGLSSRDVEAALEEVFEEPIASRSTVSRICEDIRERYRQWCRRRLEQHDTVYFATWIPRRTALARATARTRRSARTRARRRREVDVVSDADEHRAVALELFDRRQRANERAREAVELGHHCAAARIVLDRSPYWRVSGRAWAIG